eukprot:754241-Pyramimonas_sp.AAC.1
MIRKRTSERDSKTEVEASDGDAGWRGKAWGGGGEGGGGGGVEEEEEEDKGDHSLWWLHLVPEI